MSDVHVKFLTDDGSLQEVCRKYWQTNAGGSFLHPAIHLAASLRVHAGRLAKEVRKFCIAYDVVQSCAGCGAHPVLADYQSRSRGQVDAVWTCRVCLENARQAAEVEERRRVQGTAEHFAREYEQKRVVGIVPKNITLRDALYLVSFLQASASEDLNLIEPIESFSVSLGVTPEHSQNIVARLYGQGLICVDPLSRTDAFMPAEQESVGFHANLVSWLIPLSEIDPPAVEVYRAFRQDLSIPTAWSNFAAERAIIHHEIALQEALNYLRRQLEELGFEMKPGPRLLSVLESALESFELGQVLNFCWRAAKNAAAFLLKERITRSHAANTVPGSIERAVRRALDEAQQVRCFDYSADQPISVVTDTALSRVLDVSMDEFMRMPVPAIARQIGRRSSEVEVEMSSR